MQTGDPQHQARGQQPEGGRSAACLDTVAGGVTGPGKTPGILIGFVPASWECT